MVFDESSSLVWSCGIKQCRSSCSHEDESVNAPKDDSDSPFAESREKTS